MPFSLFVYWAGLLNLVEHLKAIFSMYFSICFENCHYLIELYSNPGWAGAAS